MTGEQLWQDLAEGREGMRMHRILRSDNKPVGTSNSTDGYRIYTFLYSFIVHTSS